MNGLMSLGLFLAAGVCLLAGFPVAFTLAGVALIFALLGIMTGIFDPSFLSDSSITPEEYHWNVYCAFSPARA